MAARSFPTVKSLLIAAALFVCAGVTCSARISSPLIVRCLSRDGTLEESTVRRIRGVHLSLLATGGAMASLALMGLGARRYPSTPASIPGARRALFAALLLFAVYLLFLPPYYAMSMFRDDPVRYAFSAYNMYEGKGYLIAIGRQYYPAKDFIGFPLLILPFYALFGPFPGNAIYATFACSMVVLLLTFGICRRVLGTSAAFFSILLLLSHRLFLSLCREVRSEMFSCALLLCVIFLFMELMKRERLWGTGAFLLGVVLAWCYITRPPLLAALVALPAIFLSCRGMRMAAKGMALVCAGGVLVVLPYMLFCAALYGGPLRTGYYVWEILPVPLLSLKNIAMNIPPRWIPLEPQNAIQVIERFLATTNGAYYASSLLGLGSIYSPAVFVFLVMGIAASLGTGSRVDRLGREMVLAFLSVIALHVLFYMLYAGHDERFFLAILPLIFSLAAFGMCHALARVRGERIAVSAFASLALFSLVVSGVCLSLCREVRSPRTPPFQYEVCRAYGRLLPPDGCVISGVHPTLVDHYLLRGTDCRFYAVSEKAMCVGKLRLVRDGSLSPIPVEPVQRHLGEVRAMLRSGRVVMLDDWHDPWHPGQFDSERAAIFEEFAAREVYRSGPFRIHQLFPRRESDPPGAQPPGPIGTSTSSSPSR